MMITATQYFIGRPHSEEQASNAAVLLYRVNALLHAYCEVIGKDMTTNPKTNSLISGETNGGFRLPDCPIGAPDSSHKQGMAVDVFDHDEALDDFITDAILEQYNLYREAPMYTIGWCHLSTRAPHSGHRTFIP